MKIAGVEWDDGNIDHCQKHGVSRDDIEHVLRTMTFRIPDPNPGTYLRPISARYMHEEIKHYEQIEKEMADPADR